MPQDKPEPLAQAETLLKQQVTNDFLHRNPDGALAVWEAAYQSFASTHSKQDAQTYLNDTTAYFKQHGWMADMAAAFGVELKKDQVLDRNARISSAEISQIESGSDPFKSVLASELKQDANQFLTENNKSVMAGGVPYFHWYGHPVDGVGVDDLNHHLDQVESYERAVRLQRDLLAGNGESVFNKVAQNAHKNPEHDELYREDFSNFYNATQKKLADERDENKKADLQSQLEVVGRVLQNWNEDSVKLVGDQSLTPPHISKREMGVGHDVQELYGQRVDGLVYRTADVLSNSGIFETIGAQRGQSADSVRLSTSDIAAFLKEHGNELTRYQYGVLSEVVNHLTYQPKYWVLGLIGEMQYDERGNGYLTFRKSSIENGQERYLSK